MPNSVHFRPVAPPLPSLMGHASPSLSELAESVPELHTIDRAALLANVQDDMAAMLANLMRRQTSRRSDTLAEREHDVREEPYNGERDEHVEKVRALLHSKSVSWKAAYDLARGLFPDPADLALLLAGLREDPAIDEAIRKDIKEALAALLAEQGFENVAPTLNIRHVVSSFAARTSLAPDSLRKAYRSLLSGGSGVSVTYRYLIDLFGFEQRGTALDFLEQALAVDMAADIPSRANDAFQPLVDLLFQFRLLRSADCLLVAAARQQQGLDRSVRFTQSDLLDRAVVDLLLVALEDTEQACHQFHRFLQDWHALALPGQIAPWARGVLRAFSEVPVELFVDLACREALLVHLSETVTSLFYRRDFPCTALGNSHV